MNTTQQIAPDAEISICANTDGSYMIRIELASGTTEVRLSPAEFAKAITGKMAVGVQVK